MRYLLALAFALCVPLANSATDRSSLQQLNAGLTAYQHDHGELPQAFGDLVPRYIPAVPEGCTYDFGADSAPADFSVILSPSPVPKGASSRDLRVIEERYFGDSVPVATCTLASGAHTYLTLDGQVYSSRKPWEFTPQSIAAVLNRINRDLSTDPAQLVRDWSLDGVLKVFSPMVDRELPPEARTSMGKIAGRLTASAQKMAPSAERKEMLSIAAWWRPWTTAGAGGFGLGWFLSRSRGRDTIWFSGGTPGCAPVFTRFVDDKLTVIVLANTDAMDSQAMAVDVAQFFLPSARSIEDNEPGLTQKLQQQVAELTAEPKSFYKDLGPLKAFHLIRQSVQDGQRVRAYRAVFENAELIQTFTITTSGEIAEISVSFE